LPKAFCCLSQRYGKEPIPAILAHEGADFSMMKPWRRQMSFDLPSQSSELTALHGAIVSASGPER